MRQQRDAFAQAASTQGRAATPDELDRLVTVALTVSTVVGLASAAVWFWMSRVTARGSKWGGLGACLLLALALGVFFGGLLPTDGLGGAAAGRGWMRRRYIGRLKAFGSLELRFEPLELKVRRHTLGIGLKGFVDLGVVAQRMQDLPKHWHVSGGTGLQVIWDRFAVLRLDAAFSRESFGIYFINEHAF